MTLQTLGPWLSIFGGLLFAIVGRVAARNQPGLTWPLMAAAAAMVVGPMAPLLRGYIGEPVQIAISLSSIALSAAGMIGLFAWRWKRLSR